MPLVRCPDCAREVSDAAPACVHCGRPIALAVATSAAPPLAYKHAATAAVLTCPSCGSPDVRRLPMIHDGGFARITGQTRGIAFDLGGGVAFGGARSNSVSQTELSRRAAPPRRQSPAWSIAGMLGGTLLALGDLGANSYGAAAGFMALALVSLAFFYRTERWNRRVWPQLYGRWERGCMCERCGQTFDPEVTR